MLLDFLVALAFGLPVSLGIALPIVAPIETKRFLKFARSEFRWAIAKVGMSKGERNALRGPRNLSIDVVLHAQMDVDMQWWDEEFEKLQRATVTDDWMTLSERRVVHDLLPPMSAEWARGGITSITDGDVTYTATRRTVADEVKAFEDGIRAAVPYSPSGTDDYDLTVDLAAHTQAVSIALNNGMVTAAEAKAALERDATPPGMSASLGEARRAGVSLEHARQALINCVRDARGVKNIPPGLSMSVREDIEEATTWEMLIDAAIWANAALGTYQDSPAVECEECEYVEEMTYASKYVKRRVAAMCRKCMAEDIKEVSGYWG